jgi:DNA repair protein RadC
MAVKPKAAAPPRGTGPNGAKLWREILGAYELQQHELALLTEAVRLVDELDRLHEIIAHEELITVGPHGSKVHPAVTAAKELRICLARIVVALRVPLGDQEAESRDRRPQRRGPRGVHIVGA